MNVGERVERSRVVERELEGKLILREMSGNRIRKRVKD